MSRKTGRVPPAVELLRAASLRPGIRIRGTIAGSYLASRAIDRRRREDDPMAQPLHDGTRIASRPSMRKSPPAVKKGIETNAAEGVEKLMKQEDVKAALEQTATGKPAPPRSPATWSLWQAPCSG